MFKIENNEIKLIITDMDGTLYSLESYGTSDNLINLKNQYWLQKAIENGVYVVMNTGNLPFLMETTVKDLTGEFNEFNKYFISCNGNVIHDFKDKKTWIENYFDKNLLKLIISKLDDYQLIYDITSHDATYLLHSDQQYKELMIEFQKSKYANFNHLDLTNENFNKLLSSPKISIEKLKLSDKSSLIKLFENEFSKYNVKTTWWSENGVDLVIGETNKFNGIKNLIKIINENNGTSLTIDNVLYFGDNYNDLTVFQNLKYTIAVENAIDELKTLAFDISCNAIDGALGTYLQKIWIDRP